MNKMTVGELIRELYKFSPNAEVIADDLFTSIDIEVVEEEFIMYKKTGRIRIGVKQNGTES